MSIPRIAQLVPHAEPMVLLDEMITLSPGSAECVMQVREHAPFVVDGGIGAPMTIEHMAQAVAACLGYEAYLGGAGVRVGMIIACKRFEVFVQRVVVGDALTIRVARTRGNDTLSHFECGVHRGDERIASATLTLFHGEPPKS
jgi:predicted hotdog family 3-hydroxylacyl-ACP dehydratase